MKLRFREIKKTFRPAVKQINSNVGIESMRSKRKPENMVIRNIMGKDLNNNLVISSFGGK